jgi:hypothetical protein
MCSNYCGNMHRVELFSVYLEFWVMDTSQKHVDIEYYTESSDPFYSDEIGVQRFVQFEKCNC